MTQHPGVSPCITLTIVFAALKVTGVIDWSWLWVLAPLWLPVCALVAYIVALFVIVTPFVLLYRLLIETDAQARQREMKEAFDNYERALRRSGW